MFHFTVPLGVESIHWISVSSISFRTLKIDSIFSIDIFGHRILPFIHIWFIINHAYPKEHPLVFCVHDWHSSNRYTLINIIHVKKIQYIQMNQFSRRRKKRCKCHFSLKFICYIQFIPTHCAISGCASKNPSEPSNLF